MAYTGLTPTTTLRYLKRMLGTVIQDLEITDDEMMRVVFQESVPTYSKYFPYRYKLGLTPDDILDEKYPNVYKLPNKDRLEIFGVHRVWLSNMNQFGGSLLPLVNNPFESQFLNDYLSKTVTPTTFEFQAPDMITIKPKIYMKGSALIEVKAIHPKHLKTIPIAMREQFLQLCLDDVLLTLYPIKHRFATMNSVYGSIEVFTEMVDTAKDDKQQLLDKWAEAYLRQDNVKRL